MNVYLACTLRPRKCPCEVDGIDVLSDLASYNLMEQPKLSIIRITYKQMKSGGDPHIQGLRGGKRKFTHFRADFNFSFFPSVPLDS